jgi:hypothetical protein
MFLYIGTYIHSSQDNIFLVRRKELILESNGLARFKT